MRSIVDRFGVKPLCSIRLWLCKRLFTLARRTCAKTLPGTDSRVIPHLCIASHGKNGTTWLKPHLLWIICHVWLVHAILNQCTKFHKNCQKYSPNKGTYFIGKIPNFDGLWVVSPHPCTDESEICHEKVDIVVRPVEVHPGWLVHT